MDDYVMGKLPQLKFQINLIIDKVKILKTQAPETEEDAYHYLNSIDMHPLGLFNSDIVVARLH